MHIWKLMAQDLGMDAHLSATPTTRYRSFTSKLKFLLRETCGYFIYLYIETVIVVFYFAAPSSCCCFPYSRNFCNSFSCEGEVVNSIAVG
ncbi:hypothetical protein CEN45_10450 [Fischerella thermalis CCMEE 5198]|nr:hypothetical protein CI594_01555 [Fischerella thermalis CCMEE 5196]PMB23415.1 hypothetical protein CEN45_10450 [Fischerella thermalis CCMEE 5198]PMB50449.1 hypothetical protein CEN39_18625 [Fischerella thermalis CCMEE 5201]